LSGVDAGRIAAVRTSDERLVAALGAELPRAQRIARLLTGNADVADELVAEAVARMMPRWRDDAIADLPAYLRRTMVNLAARRWRRRALGRRLDHAALDWERHSSPLEDDTVERDRTLRAVLGLPPRRRAVVVLRFYDDLSMARIADVLGVSEGTVKSQLSRALEQLRAELADLDE